MATLAEHRLSHARQVVGRAGAHDDRLVAAIAAVPREDFLGPGPWLVASATGYHPTPDADPRRVYEDRLFALDAARGLNNGEPSLHARCLAAVSPQPGERVVHVGAGTGYYTAILAELVGPPGRVDAWEIEPVLARRAAALTAPWPQVHVHAGSALGAALPPADVVYVNAGATFPPAAWLDALAIGGRLVLPLTPPAGAGPMLLVTRTGADAWAARSLGPVVFTPCIGAQDEGDALADAMRRGRLDTIRSLRRGSTPDASAWCAGRGWWLSTEPPPLS